MPDTEDKEFQGDNFHIKVVGIGKKMFLHAMKIAFMKQEKASHYRIDEKFGFVLYWHEDDRATAFPFEYTEDLAVETIWKWLVEKAKYPSQPDQDGSNYKGFCVYNYDFGYHSEDTHDGFVAVKPEWMMYGK